MSAKIDITVAGAPGPLVSFWLVVHLWIFVTWRKGRIYGNGSVSTSLCMTHQSPRRYNCCKCYKKSETDFTFIYAYCTFCTISSKAIPGVSGHNFLLLFKKKTVVIPVCLRRTYKWLWRYADVSLCPHNDHYSEYNHSFTIPFQACRKNTCIALFLLGYCSNVPKR